MVTDAKQITGSIKRSATKIYSQYSFGDGRFILIAGAGAVTTINDAVELIDPSGLPSDTTLQQYLYRWESHDTDKYEIEAFKHLPDLMDPQYKRMLESLKGISLQDLIAQAKRVEEIKKKLTG